GSILRIEVANAASSLHKLVTVGPDRLRDDGSTAGSWNASRSPTALRRARRGFDSARNAFPANKGAWTNVPQLLRGAARSLVPRRSTHRAALQPRWQNGCLDRCPWGYWEKSHSTRGQQHAALDPSDPPRLRRRGHECGHLQSAGSGGGGGHRGRHGQI